MCSPRLHPSQTVQYFVVTHDCGLQVEIILVKSGQFDELMAAAAEEREVAPEVEDQS